VRRTVGSTNEEEREDRRGREHGRDEARRCCRRRKRHGSHRAPDSTGILPLTG
jgi:hypothetical protein